MKIKPIGQGGYVVSSETAKIIIDPYLSDIVNEREGFARLLPQPFKPEETEADAVICTHNHMDHLDIGAVPLMPENQFFITTNEGVIKLKELNHTNAISLSVGESVLVGDIEITAVYANHTCEAFGLIIKADDVTAYFSGDTLFDEKLFEISEYKPDITFICINGRLGNMDVKEAIITAQKIGAKINVPAHYDMFAENSENPLLFSEKIEGGRVFEFNKEYEI